jgi:hypothetical protein
MRLEGLGELKDPIWDTTLCSPLKINRRFGTCRLCLQGRRISQARNQCEKGGKHSSAVFLLGLFFYPEDGSDMFLRNIG